MPRRSRILIEGGLHHVYNRFARGESVFTDPEEAIAFVDLLLNPVRVAVFAAFLRDEVPE